MKKVWAGVVVYLFLIQAQAQEMNMQVKWGKGFYDDNESSLDHTIIGTDATGLYAFKERYTSLIDINYTLEHYGSNLLRDKSFDLDLIEDGNHCEIDYIVLLKGRLFMFYSNTDQKTKKNMLFVKEIDKTSLMPTGKSMKIGEIDYTGKSKINKGDFLFRTSRDSSKMMVVYSLPTRQEEPEAFGFSVLDTQLNSLWKKDIKMPYPGNLFEIKTYRVDNEGNAYLLGMLHNATRGPKREPDYHYEIVAVRDKGANLTQYPVEVPGFFLSDMQIEIHDNRNLICAGFYSQGGTFSIRGTFFLQLDADTKDIKTECFNEFGTAFITQYTSWWETERITRKEEKGIEPELPEFNLDKLLVGKDGSAILVAEQYYYQIINYRYISRRAPSPVTHYYNNDIIVVKIDPHGQILWTRKVPKSQHTVGNDKFYSSYTMAIVNGSICLIFNDSPYNMVVEEKLRPKSYGYGKSQSAVMLVSINQQGDMSKQAITSASDNFSIRTKMCRQIYNDQVILFGKRRNTQQLAQLTFK